MKMIEITAKEVKEKYPTLKKLFDAINNRQLRSEDQIWVDANYFQDLEELEKASNPKLMLVATMGVQNYVSRFIRANPTIEKGNEKISNELSNHSNCELEEEVFYTDFTALPSYGDDGDDEPSEVVWSWDKENFIVGDEIPFSLIAREPTTINAF